MAAKTLKAFRFKDDVAGIITDLAEKHGITQTDVVTILVKIYGYSETTSPDVWQPLNAEFARQAERIKNAREALQ